MKNGIVSNWNEEKGFGFIAPDSGGKSVFFHINDYSQRHKRPSKDLEVYYSVSKDPKGRICAIDVVPLRGHRNNARELRQKSFSLVLFGAISAVLFYLYESRLIPLEIVCLYAIMSVVTFLVYAKDKSAAKWDDWRTPESKLQMLSLLGGWPGATLAQSFLRHKSKKMSFRVTYWMMVIVNCACLYWLTTPKGHFWLKAIIDNSYRLVSRALHQGASDLF